MFATLGTEESPIYPFYDSTTSMAARWGQTPDDLDQILASNTKYTN